MVGVFGLIKKVSQEGMNKIPDAPSPQKIPQICNNQRPYTAKSFVNLGIFLFVNS